MKAGFLVLLGFALTLIRGLLLPSRRPFSAGLNLSTPRACPCDLRIASTAVNRELSDWITITTTLLKPGKMSA